MFPLTTDLLVHICKYSKAPVFKVSITWFFKFKKLCYRTFHIFPEVQRITLTNIHVTTMQLSQVLMFHQVYVNFFKIKETKHYWYLCTLQAHASVLTHSDRYVRSLSPLGVLFCFQALHGCRHTEYVSHCTYFHPAVLPGVVLRFPPVDVYSSSACVFKAV